MAVTETARSTVRAMLDTLAPTDPILLLVVVDGHFLELPSDVKAWFGPLKDNRVELPTPSSSERAEFFEPMLRDVRRPPNRFADGVKRKRRVLENLPIAPPLEPRQPTVAELAVQEENDHKLITLLKYHLGLVLTELKCQFKRFTKCTTVHFHSFFIHTSRSLTCRCIQEEYNFDEDVLLPICPPPAPILVSLEPALANGIFNAIEGPSPDAIIPDLGPSAEGPINGIVHHHEEEQLEQQQSEKENHEAKCSKVNIHDESDPLNMISLLQLRVHFEMDVGAVQIPIRCLSNRMMILEWPLMTPHCENTQQALIPCF